MPKPKYGFYGGHIEYHTVNQHKEKAADCIYLTNKRICTNSKSTCFDAKCFIASYCPLRKKESEYREELVQARKYIPQEPQLTPEPKKCPYKVGYLLIHKTWGKGKIISIEDNRFTMQFENKTATFLYPNAITDGHIKPIYFGKNKNKNKPQK